MKHFISLEGISSIPVKGIKLEHVSLLGFISFLADHLQLVSHSGMIV